jgi:hypothetical protein
MGLSKRNKEEKRPEKFVSDFLLPLLVEVIARRGETTIEWRQAFSSWIAAGITAADMCKLSGPKRCSRNSQAVSERRPVII